MLRLKTNARYLSIITSLIVVGASVLLRAAAGLLQGSDGTPDGTAPLFSIEPISLVIGIAAGGLAVGIPVIAHAVKNKDKKPTPTRDVPDRDCDGIDASARGKTKGWDGTIKGVKAVDDASASREKKRPGRESPTLASRSIPEDSLINPIAMDKGLRVDAPPETSSLAKEKVKTNGEGKKEYVGHVTLMK